MKIKLKIEAFDGPRISPEDVSASELYGYVSALEKHYSQTLGEDVTFAITQVRKGSCLPTLTTSSILPNEAIRGVSAPMVAFQACAARYRRRVQLKSGQNTWVNVSPDHQPYSAPSPKPPSQYYAAVHGNVRQIEAMANRDKAQLRTEDGDVELLLPRSLREGLRAAFGKDVVVEGWIEATESKRVMEVSSLNIAEESLLQRLLESEYDFETFDWLNG